jgi:hypothetical protein
MHTQNTIISAIREANTITSHTFPRTATFRSSLFSVSRILLTSGFLLCVIKKTKNKTPSKTAKAAIRICDTLSFHLSIAANT